MDKKLKAIKLVNYRINTCTRLKCREEVNTYFENFHRVFAFSGEGFAVCDSLISPSYWVPYSDERVTVEDLNRLANAFVEVIKRRLVQVINQEEIERKQREFEDRLEIELAFGVTNGEY